MSTENRKSYEILGQLPNIYIPMLFSNISHARLLKIIKQLDIFTPAIMNFEEKQDLKGNKCNCAFIQVEHWHDTPQAKQFRAKLLANEEVKIVFDDPWFFICKRKHEEGEEELKTTTSATLQQQTHRDQQQQQQEQDDPEFKIAEAPRNVRGVSRTRTPSPSDPDYCPECEEGVENQMGHTCIWRMMEEGSSTGSLSSNEPSPLPSPSPTPQLTLTAPQELKAY
jgi:hypothetical protein